MLAPAKLLKYRPFPFPILDTISAEGHTTFKNPFGLRHFYEILYTNNNNKFGKNVRRGIAFVLHHIQRPPPHPKRPPGEARPLPPRLYAAPAGAAISHRAAVEFERPSPPTTVSDVSTFRDALAAVGFGDDVAPWHCQ